MTKRPYVLTKCVANTYAAPNERIIEFEGGLIRFVKAADGKLHVQLYRLDDNVCVNVDKAHLIQE